MVSEFAARAEAMAGYTFLDENAEMKKLTAKGGMYVRDMIYGCRDGKYITCGAVTMKEWKGMCKALGKEEWLTDERFQTAAGLAAHRAERLDMIADALGLLDSRSALALLEAAGVPCGPVHHPRHELLSDPQLAANQTLIEAEHPVCGKMVFPRPAARFDSEFSIRHHAPLIGEHTLEVLTEAGVSEDEIQQLTHKKVIRVTAGLH